MSNFKKYIVYIKSSYVVEADSEGLAEDIALEKLAKDIEDGNVHTAIEEEKK